MCVLVLVIRSYHDQILCIVKVCVLHLFWSREVTHNTEVAALRCGGYEAIFVSQYFITSQQATQLSFPHYNRQISYVFLYLWGGKKASL